MLCDHSEITIFLQSFNSPARSYEVGDAVIRCQESNRAWTQAWGLVLGAVVCDGLLPNGVGRIDFVNRSRPLFLEKGELNLEEIVKVGMQHNNSYTSSGCSTWENTT